MNRICPTMRLMWIAALNPVPLKPEEWLLGVIKDKPREITARGFRQSMAVCEGDGKLFTIHASRWGESSAVMIYSVSYPQPKQTQLL